MTFEEIRDVIVDTINCEVEAVTMEARLSEDLGADSLDAVELSMAIEEAFDIKTPDDMMVNMKTVGDIVNYLTSLE